MWEIIYFIVERKPEAIDLESKNWMEVFDFALDIISQRLPWWLRL